MTSLVIFAVLAGLGRLLPDVYYRYLDTREYYVVEQPVPVDKEVYKACDDTLLVAKRKAMVDLIAVFSTDLTLINQDGIEYKVPSGHIDTEASVRRGEIVVGVIYKLPCDIPEGRYFWQSTMAYEMRDVPKVYTYISEIFEVSEDGEPLGQDFGNTPVPFLQRPSTPAQPQPETPRTQTQQGDSNTQTTTVTNSPSPESGVSVDVPTVPNDPVSNAVRDIVDTVSDLLE